MLVSVFIDGEKISMNQQKVQEMANKFGLSEDFVIASYGMMKYCASRESEARKLQHSPIFFFSWSTWEQIIVFLLNKPYSEEYILVLLEDMNADWFYLDVLEELV